LSSFEATVLKAVLLARCHKYPITSITWRVGHVDNFGANCIAHFVSYGKCLKLTNCSSSEKRGRERQIKIREQRSLLISEKREREGGGQIQRERGRSK
jgi:hypothetical protein